MVLLLIAVGISVTSGMQGISTLDRSLREVTERDAERLLAVTSIRRLFRSEVVIDHELDDTQDSRLREEFKRRREEIREQRAVQLDRLSRLGVAGQSGTLEALVRDHELSLKEGHESARSWEANTAQLVGVVQTQLKLAIDQAGRTTAEAKTRLIGTSALAALTALLLGGFVLYRVQIALSLISSSEAQFRAVVQSAPSLLAMLGMDGEPVYLPPRAPTFLGISAERLNQDPLCWIDGNERQALERGLAEARAGSTNVPTLTLRATRDDQSSWFASASVTPIFDAQRQVTAVILQLLDVSALKAAEQAQKELETQLRQSQKMETVGRLAGGIAHDFNNLLTAIQGYASLARDDPTASDVPELVAGIEHAAERAAHLTRQLLTFSRKHVLNPTATDLGELVAGIEKMLARVIGEDVSLEVRADKGTRNCLVDRNQIEQVVLNLAINARHAMPNGGKILIEVHNADLDEGYIARHPTALPGEYLLLSVSDTGIGMSKDILEHIFEPFFTTKPVGQGTGLGLSVVYGTIQQHGGTIDVYSEVGLGTTFRIYLPAAASPTDTPGKAEEPRVKLRGSERLLLVEDDPLVRDFATRTLSSQGYEVASAGDATEAVRIVAELAMAPQLLITDVILPGMTGVELAQVLEQKLPTMPVLYMSGYSDQLMTQRGQLPESVDYLPKPFNALTLIKRVRHALDRQEPTHPKLTTWH